MYIQKTRVLSGCVLLVSRDNCRSFRGQHCRRILRAYDFCLGDDNQANDRGLSSRKIRISLADNADSVGRVLVLTVVGVARAPSLY